MVNTPSTRRRFLSRLASAALGAAVAPRALAAAEAFEGDLSRLRLGDGSASRFARLADEYMLDPGILYLNHASIGTVPAAVHRAHSAYAELCETNPWLYMWGGAWEAGREDARAAVASLMGAEPDDVALTHNTTEGFNLLAQGLPLGPGDEVLFSDLNHDGASVCFDHQAVVRGFRVRRFESGAADAARMDAESILDRYDRAIGPDTRLLVLPHLDNAVGIRTPLVELVALARSRGVEWIAVDGAQTLGMLPLDLSGSGVDVYAASPHKWVQSPKGLGALYLTPGLREALRPMWVTWGQRRWAGTVRVYEDYGTRNLAELLSLTDAVDFQNRLGAEAKERRYRELHGLVRARVDDSPVLRWRSPPAFDDGGCLMAVEVVGREATEVGAELAESDGLIVRSFAGPALNTLRLAPNVATRDEQLHRALDLLEAAAP